MSELDGMGALITGASRGIGLATARLLAARGARVVLADRSGAVEQAARDIGNGASAIRFDLRDPAGVAALAAEAEARLGRVDAAAHCAAIFPAAPLPDLDEALLAEVLDVNLAGTIRLCRALLPRMAAHGLGSLVNLASGAALRPIASLSLYGASKAGVIAFSRTLALESAPHVRVNVVAPGTTATEAVRAQLESVPEEVRSRIVGEIPMGRFAEPAEVAEAIVFLLSSRARFITGATLTVNGGSTMP